MKKLKDLWNNIPEEMTVTKLDGALILADVLLFGIILGIFFAPRRKATYGCGNGTTTIYEYGIEEEEAEAE